MCGTCGGHGEHQPMTGEGARIVVVGKGGVGKSTITALLARQLSRGGTAVIAIDADEQRNLGTTLGIGQDELDALVPVSSAGDYIEEKTGARPGEGAGGMLRLNPDTADLIDRFSIPGPDGVRLLVMGGVQRAGGGCLCPENALLAAAIAGMRMRRGEVVVMDTHAGVEHFGRALARGFDGAVVVIDPTYNAAQVGIDTARLAGELGISDIHLVINRVRAPRDRERALGHIGQLGGFDFTSIHDLPYDQRVLDTEPSIDGLLDDSDIARATTHVAVHLMAHECPHDSAGDMAVMR